MFCQLCLSKTEENIFSLKTQLHEYCHSSWWLYIVHKIQIYLKTQINGNKDLFTVFDHEFYSRSGWCSPDLLSFVCLFVCLFVYLFKSVCWSAFC